MWPHFELTDFEKQHCSLYEEPGSKRAVRRTIYQGRLELNALQRVPVYNFGLSKRCRVVAFTAIGDVDKMRLQFSDSSGEDYNVQPIAAVNLLGGFSYRQGQDIGGNGSFGRPAAGAALYIAPYVIEPNILLMANQTLRVRASEILPYDSEIGAFRVDFALHVVEFPPSFPRGK